MLALLTANPAFTLKWSLREEDNAALEGDDGPVDGSLPDRLLRCHVFKEENLGYLDLVSRVLQVPGLQLFGFLVQYGAKLHPPRHGAWNQLLTAVQATPSLRILSLWVH